MSRHEPPSSWIAPDAPQGALARAYLDALLAGDRHGAGELVLDAVRTGVPVRDVYLDVFQPVQREVGRLWQTGEISVAGEHYCTAATQLIMSRLYPWVFSGVRDQGTLVAAAAPGELHELGVRMVADFFEMAGWDTTYLGANVPSSSVVELVGDRRPDVLALSATLWERVDAVADVIRGVRASRDLDRVAILVGGYPFNADPELSGRLGADGWGADAEAAVAEATRLTAGGAHR